MIASLFRRQLGATLISFLFFLAVSITVRRSLRALGAEGEVFILRIFRLLTKEPESMKKAVVYAMAALAVALCVRTLLGAVGTPDVWAQARPFYEGKTVNLIVFGAPGGGNDFLARLLTRHMPKHISGRPGFLVQNMPGAAGMIATNYLYTVAKPDGLTIGLIAPGLYQAQLIGRPEVQFDWAKLGWIGTDETSVLVIYIRADTGYKTVDDVRMPPDSLLCAESGVGSRNYAYIRLIEEVFGAKFKPVVGYKGSGEVNLAVERGGVVCRSTSVAALLTTEPLKRWLKTRFIQLLVQSGKKRHAAFPDVPTVWDLAEKYHLPEEDRQLMALALAAVDFGRPFVAPPGLPKDRLETLRDSFLKTMTDPDFLKEASKANLEIKPKSGAELERLAQAVIGISPKAATRLKRLLE